MSIWLEVPLSGKTASEFPEMAQFHIVYAANPADLALIYNNMLSGLEELLLLH